MERINRCELCMIELDEDSEQYEVDYKLYCMLCALDRKDTYREMFRYIGGGGR